MARWDHVGYAEVTYASQHRKSKKIVGLVINDGDNVEVSNPEEDESDVEAGGNSELSFNTFEVEVRLYQLAPEEGTVESQLQSGWIGTYYYDIHLVQEENSWSIDSIISLDQTGGERERAQYGRILLAYKASTWAAPDKSDDRDKRHTKTIKSTSVGGLPVYCKIDDDSGTPDSFWYRTSLGWVHELDIETHEIRNDRMCHAKMSSFTVHE
ncbi:hypothetical protein [Glutamicibacter uratoxydans]|uniref:hypothetical protein n=1 Tax=Glutamicibacter uratoxydans TaxID=43667 RepID=UPI003D6E948E